MSNWLIDKSATTELLGNLLKDRRVYAPVRRDGLVNYESLGRGDEAAFDFRNSKRPPKEIFLPCSEILFTYEGSEVTGELLPDEQGVVFGVRPCDARSLILLDNVFREPGSQDPYYAARRERITLIGLGCDRPLSTCFCTVLGGGPFALEGLDLLLTDLGDRYLVESITDRGEALVADGSQFRAAAASDVDLKSSIVARAEQQISGPNVKGIYEKLGAMYDSPFWDGLHEKCLGCGVCSYLCPTCHCFDIVDETVGSQGRRVRNWDTCQFSQFTHHASGHNPRPTGRERMRQRVMHKFNYFVDNFGDVACVGCGRCVRECPVNMDIRAVLEAVRTS